MFAKARSCALKVLWGSRRALRCPEVVLSLLYNCIRADPKSAIVYRGLCATRRILAKDEEKYHRLYDHIAKILYEFHPSAQGPGNGFIQLCEACNCECVLEQGRIIVRHEGTSTDIDLVGDSDAHFRRSLQRFLTQTLLQKLCDRLEIAPVNSDGDNGRKDLNGITPYVDHAALWFSSQKRRVKKIVSSPASTLTLKEDTFDMAPEEVTDKLTYLWHRHIRTIIAGAPR